MFEFLLGPELLLHPCHAQICLWQAERETARIDRGVKARRAACQTSAQPGRAGIFRKGPERRRCGTVKLNSLPKAMKKPLT